MKINRQALKQHLERIFSSGQIDKTWMTVGLGTVALSQNSRFFVHAPTLDVEFDEPFGIRGLGHIVTFLGFSDSEEVSVSFDGTRLVFDDPYELKLVVPDEMVARSVEDDQAEQILSVIDDGVSAPIGTEVLKKVRSASSLISGDRARLEVGGNKSMWQFGVKTGDIARVPFPNLTQPGDGYTLELDRDSLLAALSNINDPDEAEFVVTGAESLAAVREDGYTWGIDDLS